MSRSKRKTKIFGNTTAESEKKCKKLFHRKYRALERHLITKIEQEIIDPDDVSFYNEEETFNVYGMEKDGKQYFQNSLESDMRK